MRYNNQEDFIDIGKVSTVINEKIEQGQSVGIYSQGEINLNLKNIEHVIDIYCEGKDHYNDIKIKGISDIYTDKPDFLIVLSKECDQEVINKTSFIYEWGGKHILLNTGIEYLSRKVTSKVVSTKKDIVLLKGDKKFYENRISQIKVDKYWDYLGKKVKTFFNGIMFSIYKCEEDSDKLYFYLEETDYKHMIYTKEHDFRNYEHTCTVASIALIKTKDGYSVLGKMSGNTAFANKYKCIGGALDFSDLDLNLVNIKRLFQREILEELGIDICNNNICSSIERKWLLIRERMAFVGLCSEIQLNLNRDELTELFNNFRKIDKEKEVSCLLFVKSFEDIYVIDENKKADYVDELYATYFEVKKAVTWDEYKEQCGGELFI